LFGITGISGLSNPLGSEGLASTKPDDDEDSGECAPVKKAGGTNGTHTEGGIVKANKGMILRKSVEYIKYAFLHSHMGLLVGKLTLGYFHSQIPPAAGLCPGVTEPRP